MARGPSRVRGRFAAVRFIAIVLSAGSLIAFGQVAPSKAQALSGTDAPTLPALSADNNLVGQAGGQASTPDGRVQVTIPAGALSEEAYVVLSSDQGKGDLTAFTFEVQAVVPGAKTALSGFASPLPIEVTPSKEDLGRLSADVSELTVQRLEPATNEWPSVNSLADTSKNTLSFSTDKTGRFRLARSQPLDKTESTTFSPQAGAELVAADGLQIAMPTDASAEDLRIEYKPYETGGFKASTQRIVRQFELNAYAVNRADALVSQFEKPVDVVVPHSSDDLLGLRAESLRLYSWDELKQQWTLVPDQKVANDGTITAQLSHFSVYSTQTSSNIAGTGLNLYHQVDLHSGAATLSYPIELPAGPGGFRPPPLALSYSSSTVNEMKDIRNLGSWVGIGWDISVPAVVYDPTTAKFYLSLDGTFDQLLDRGDEPGMPGVRKFSTKNENYLRIRAQGLTGTSAATVEVTDKQGAKYLFGGLSLGGPIDSYQRYYYNYAANQKVRYRLDLARVIDTNLNYADYHYWRDRGAYTQTTCPPAFTSENPCQNVRAAYLTSLEWGSATTSRPVSNPTPASTPTT